MFESFLALGFVERLFCYSAAFGSLFFVIRMFSMILGFMASSDGDAFSSSQETIGEAADLDGNGITDVIESGSPFPSLLSDSDGNGIPDILENANDLPEKLPLLKRFLSLQNVSAFFMMFGWVGLAMMHSSGFGSIPSVFAGVVAGTAMAFVLTVINDWLMGLRSCGNIRLSSAKGRLGRVYLRIPKGGSGQVEVEVDGRLKICEAISANENETIDFDTKVLIVDLKDLDTLIVTPYKN